MSRYIKKKGDQRIAYGYDPTPMGGYFFQVFEGEGDEERVIVNEGFVKGISRSKMLSLMKKWGVEKEEHVTKIVLDLPF